MPIGRDDKGTKKGSISAVTRERLEHNILKPFLVAGVPVLGLIAWTRLDLKLQADGHCSIVFSLCAETQPREVDCALSEVPTTIVLQPIEESNEVEQKYLDDEMRVQVKFVLQYPPSMEDRQGKHRECSQRYSNEERLKRFHEFDVPEGYIMLIIDKIQVNLIREGGPCNHPRKVQIIRQIIDKRSLSFLLPSFLLEPLGIIGQLGDQKHDVDRTVHPPNTVNVASSP